MGMTEGGRILLVEDDVGVARMLERGLTQAGYHVDWTRNLGDAVSRVSALAHDLIVLDRMLPDGDGADLCAALRKFGHPARVCMLTARDALEDKLRGFDAGADDYLVKPFEFDELLARLHALSRRGPAERLGIVTDPETRIVRAGSAQAKLTKREWSLMMPLVENIGQTVAREVLLEAAWGKDADVTANTVDVYVGYLRKKFAEFPQNIRIETIRGEGFRLTT